MAVTWKKIAYEDDVVKKSTWTTKGDILVATGASTPARLGVGSNGQVLTADSGQASGVKWAAAGGGASLTVSETEVFSGTSPTSWTDLDLSGTIGSNAALVLLKFCYPDAGNYTFAVRKNGDTDEFYTVYANAARGVALAESYQGIFFALLVATDSSGVIEWKTESAKTFTIDVIAYIA
jgi:hypothetical protein